MKYYMLLQIRLVYIDTGIAEYMQAKEEEPPPVTLLPEFLVLAPERLQSVQLKHTLAKYNVLQIVRLRRLLVQLANRRKAEDNRVAYRYHLEGEPFDVIFIVVEGVVFVAVLV